MKKYLNLFVCFLFAACFSFCNWGLSQPEGDGEQEPDFTTDEDMAVDVEDDDVISEPPDDTPVEPPNDIPADPDMDTPVEPPDDVPEDSDAPDEGDAPGDPDVEIEPEIEPECGNGILEGDEECDDASDFCNESCELVPPTDDWIECTDSAGNPAFFFIEDWGGQHTWQEFRDHCASIVEGYSPENFAYYGLAVFTDEDLWNCIVGHLSESDEYFIGLYQDTSAGDYSEPDGGWYWIANDGSGWTNVDAYDPASSYLPGDLNDWGTNAECGRLEHPFMGNWQFNDSSCDSDERWDGICMIQY